MGEIVQCPQSRDQFVVVRLGALSEGLGCWLRQLEPDERFPSSAV